MFSKQRIRQWRLATLRDASGQWGSGWNLLTDEMREAYIAQAALNILRAQDLPEYQRAIALVEACLNKGEP